MLVKPYGIPLWLSLAWSHGGQRQTWQTKRKRHTHGTQWTLGLPCLVPHKGEQLFRNQKVVCHPENMHVIEKIFSGSFFSRLGVSLDLRITASNWLPTGKYIELMTADVDIDNLVRRWFCGGGVNVSRGPLGPSMIHCTSLLEASTKWFSIFMNRVGSCCWCYAQFGGTSWNKCHVKGEEQ